MKPEYRRYVGEELGRPEFDEFYEKMLKSWDEQTCSPRFRGYFSPSLPTTGQCTITSVLAQEVFGGEIVSSKVPGTQIVHSFNIIDGNIVDFAISQFEREGVFPDLSDNFPRNRDEMLAAGDNFERFLRLKSNYEKA